MNTQTRNPRDLETREATARKKVWQPADLLPQPRPVEGYSFRWVRKSLLGTSDPTNMSRSLREGWEPCRLQDHPELMLSVDPGANNSDLVEIGGLILCKIPNELFEQRNAYYRSHSEAQVESVEAALMRENDPRMPLFKESRSTVSFGKG
jgi:hypothetical protein